MIPCEVQTAFFATRAWSSCIVLEGFWAERKPPECEFFSLLSISHLPDAHFSPVSPSNLSLFWKQHLQMFWWKGNVGNSCFNGKSLMEVPNVWITFQTLRHGDTPAHRQILLLMFPWIYGTFLLFVPPNLLNQLYIPSMPSLIFIAFQVVGFFVASFFFFFFSL